MSKKMIIILGAIIAFCHIAIAEKITCPSPDDWTWWAPAQTTVDAQQSATWKGDISDVKHPDKDWSSVVVTLPTTVIYKKPLIGKIKANSPVLQTAGAGVPEISASKDRITCTYNVGGDYKTSGIAPVKTTLDLPGKVCEKTGLYYIVDCK